MRRIEKKIKLIANPLSPRTHDTQYKPGVWYTVNCYLKNKNKKKTSKGIEPILNNVHVLKLKFMQIKKPRHRQRFRKEYNLRYKKWVRFNK